MWDLAEDFTISVCTFHNLRQEISNGISIYSKEEIVEAKEIVENKVGPGVIEEKDAEFFLLELDPPNNSNLITIYVMFEENKKKHDERYRSRVFHILDGEILWVEPSYK